MSDSHDGERGALPRNRCLRRAAIPRRTPDAGPIVNTTRTVTIQATCLGSPVSRNLAPLHVVHRAPPRPSPRRGSVTTLDCGIGSSVGLAPGAVPAMSVLEPTSWRGPSDERRCASQPADSRCRKRAATTAQTRPACLGVSGWGVVAAFNAASYRATWVGCEVVGPAGPDHHGGLPPRCVAGHPAPGRDRRPHSPVAGLHFQRTGQCHCVRS